MRRRPSSKDTFFSLQLPFVPCTDYVCMYAVRLLNRRPSPAKPLIKAKRRTSLGRSESKRSWMVPCPSHYAQDFLRHPSARRLPRTRRR